MFYSQFILAKKGPLGTIWIAAHLERKLRKNQVADTDIGVSVDSILFPEMPIALRLSSHLLLGVVRIYNRKVNYLFDDCSEALLKIKQAFRSTAVDLPPEESKAPYHSITLPETFDLDDFELPDNDMLHGNYVDHHISSREQITLQDSVEGVSYSTSKFGLDERFGDGDASGLDLDEELFLDKTGTADHIEGHALESVEPQTSADYINAVKREGQHANITRKVDVVHEFDDLMDYPHAPCTPGLVEDPNFSNVQEASVGDDLLESECNLMDSAMRENTKNITDDCKQDLEWCPLEGTNFDITHQVPPEENVYQSGDLENEVSKPLTGSPPIKSNLPVLQNEFPSVDKLTDLSGQVSTSTPSLELVGNILEKSDVLCTKDMQREIFGGDKKHSFSIDGQFDANQHPNGISIVNGTSKHVSEGSSITDQTTVVEVPRREESLANASIFPVENERGYISEDPGTLAFQGPADSIAGNIHETIASSENQFLRPCNSSIECSGATNSGCYTTDADVQSNNALLATSGRDSITKTGQKLEENHCEKLASCTDFHTPLTNSDGQMDKSNSLEKPDENLNNMEEFQMSAPEKLLAVPDNHSDLLHKAILEEVIPKEFEVLDEGDTGRNIITGKKRTFTESTLTDQSINSVESLRLVRVKRTAESIPDDDDLLSSILVGRSSVFKVKPTPPFSEVTSVKRARSAPRSGPPKRKVLMDETMVLHGDTIRQQLTNTEDIRRVRKKAPCTRHEISMIQKQTLEDEIFLDSILTGMSIELVSLHCQVIDLTGIRVFQDDVDVSSLDNIDESRLASQNVGNEFSNETQCEPKLASDNEKHNIYLETSSKKVSTSQNTENCISLGMENAHIMDGTDIAEVNVMEESFEQWNARNNEMTGPMKDALLIDNKLEEFYDNREQFKAANDAEPTISQQDPIMHEVDQATAEKNCDAVNTVVISDLQSIGHANRNDDDTADVGKTNLDEAYENSFFMSIDSSNALTEKRADAPAPSVEVDEQNMKYDHEHAVCGDENEEKNVVDEEGNSGFDLNDRGESHYFVSGNDTEFLNVDDDELTDIVDDYPLDVEEAQLTENSGWSSRTRAVTKYLQMMFIKEAESGRKSLSMDNLLIGKSRKEASRMFFEALVLKTRDYIHVEQDSPHDNITIRPRTRLMKSDI